MWAQLLKGQQHHLNEIRCISNWGNVNQNTPRILFQLLFFFFSVPISFKNNISKIHVWHDNVGEHPGWFLERITIKDVSDGMKWYANSNPYSASRLTNTVRPILNGHLLSGHPPLSGHFPKSRFICQ